MRSPSTRRFCRCRFAALVIAVGLGLCLASSRGSLQAALVSSVDGDLILTVTSDGDDSISIKADAETGDVLVNGADPNSGAFSAMMIRGIIVNGGPGPNIIDLSEVRFPQFEDIPTTNDSAPPITIDGGGGNDTIKGSLFSDALIGGDGDDLLIWFSEGLFDLLEGGSGQDRALFEGTDSKDLFKAATGSNGRVKFWTFVVPLAVVFLDGVEELDFEPGGGEDTVEIGDVTETDVTSVVVHGGDGDDAFLIQNGVSVRNGITLIGGPGSDTIDYADYGMDGVEVTLGNTSRIGLGSNLDGDQNVPPSGSSATATAALSYDQESRFLDFDVFLSGLSGEDLTGISIMSARPGVQGPGILDLGGVIAEEATGIRISDSGVEFPAEFENELLTGRAALCVYSAQFPGGDIRGQVVVQTLPSTATGTLGAAAVENIVGSRGDDRLFGNAGDNFLDGRDGNDQLFGGAGDDWLSGGPGADTHDGGDGHDIVDFSDSRVGLKVKLGKAGTGSAKGEFKESLVNIQGVIGSDFADKITGSLEDNTLFGGGGNDKIVVKGGSNFIDAGDGDDKVTVGAGNDEIFGGPGSDKIVSKGGADVIDGGPDNDRIIAKSGLVIVSGGTGDDFIKGSKDGGQLNGGEGNDTIKGGKLDDVIDAGPGDDVVTGSGGNDQILGGDGNDSLRGGPGDDLIDGGAGDDFLRGDKGVDQLIGGLGLDTIVEDTSDPPAVPDP